MFTIMTHRMTGIIMLKLVENKTTVGLSIPTSCTDNLAGSTEVRSPIYLSLSVLFRLVEIFHWA